MADAIQVLTGVMHGDLEHLRSVSSNLANISTSAYKREAVTFGSMYPDAVAMQLERGNPLRMLPEVEIGVARDLSQGALKATENDLNIAIEGNAALIVSDGNNDFLTRRGELMVDSLGRLALITGERLQGMQGDIFVGHNDFSIKLDGEIVRDGQTYDRLNIVALSSNAEIEVLGGGLMRASRGNAAIEEARDYSVHQGFLEASNVDPTREVLKMIELVRHFETSSRVLQAYDDMLEKSIGDLGQF